MVIEGALLTVKEVAGELRMSERGVLKMVYRNEFPNAFKAGRAWRIPVTDLEEYVEKQKRKRQVATSSPVS